MIEKLLMRQLRKKHRFNIKGTGASMGNLIHDGDVVTVQKKKFNVIEINDIAVIYVKKKLITHRVIYKTKTYLVSRGDANMIADGKIYPHQVVGVVEQIKRNGIEIRMDNIYLVQSTLYLKEITKIVSSFTTHTIRYVILKGLPLHLYYEGKHPRRIYSDVDFLVKNTQIPRASTLLKEMGFKAQKGSLSETHRALKNHHVEIGFTKNVNGWLVVVDLHSEPAFLMTQLGDMNRLYPERLLTALSDDFINHAVKVKLNGNHVRLLSPPHLFIYLLLHFFHHNFQGVFRLDLINKVVKKMSFSPSQQAKIISTIKKYKLENYLYPSLLLLQKYFPETKNKTNNILSCLPMINRSGKARSCFAGQSLIARLTPSVFNDEGRIEGGIRRFILIFLASPTPVWKRMFVFFQPSVLFSIWWVIVRRISSFSKNHR